MDFHALQNKLFQMDPSDPKEDLAKLKAQAANPQQNVAPTVNYMQESVEVPQGSLGLDKDYSVSDFAALAGVVTESNNELMRGIQRTRKDVSDQTSVPMIQLSLQRAVDGQVLTPQQREALGPYVDALIKILSEPRFATIFDNIVKMANKKEDEETNESGLQYYTGVKKYGKEGMTKIQSAAGKGANHEEIGKIKDKYDKRKKTESIADVLWHKLKDQ
tara:strand:+ start:161 stop:814 length:654 start_codon:yes stop_codon:yes gene_type:complete